jgi:hypothetical protein
MVKRLKLSDARVCGYLSGDLRRRRKDKFYYYRRRDMSGSPEALTDLYRRLSLLCVGERLIYEGYEYWIENNRYFRRIYVEPDPSDSNP